MPMTVDENGDYVFFGICTDIGKLGEPSGFDTINKTLKLKDRLENPLGFEIKSSILNIDDTNKLDHHFDKELGIGVTLYFKMLRYLGWMFLIFAILSIPTFYFCSIQDIKNSQGGIGGTFFKLGLGNIG
jgi:hypothetical protein